MTKAPNGAKRPTPQRIDVEKRRRFVLDMVAGGATYQEAADAVLAQGMGPRPNRTSPGPVPASKYTRADAYNDCQHAMAAITSESATQHKAIMNRRLVQTQRAMIRDALNPTLPAIDRARATSVLVRLMVREAKLNGLDEPTRSQLEITAHFEQLAAISTAAVNAGADAAGLTSAQRRAMLDGMQAYLLSVEGAPASEPRAIEAAEIVDAEIIEEGA
jgi:hypothetical protein